MVCFLVHTMQVIVTEVDYTHHFKCS